MAKATCFGERLQQLRTKAKLTQALLATNANIPVETIRAYEQRRREPSWDYFLKLCEGLGVDAKAFWILVEVNQKRKS
jgi:transcriptional regulator with XRE-family HTH domain